MKSKTIKIATLFLVALSFQTFIINAQVVKKSNIKLIDSRKHISKAIELYDDKEYLKAEEMYSEIPKSDSLYPTALYERALTCYALDKLDSAAAFCEEGLTLNKIRASFIGLLGSVYDDKKQPIKAIELFKDGLKQFPYNQMMHYNLGVAYFRLDSLDLAEKEFIISAKLNPFHFRTQLFLGQLNEIKGRLIESLLCYYMACIINPENTIAASQLEKYLNGESELVSLASKYPIDENDEIPGFTLLEDIIKSKISLNPKFKTKAKINDIIVKQGQMLIDKLVYKSSVDNFYMNYHVKFFTHLRDKKYHEPFFYHILSGFENEKISAWLKKKKKKHDAMIDWAVKNIIENRNTGFVNLTLAKDTIFYVFDDKNNLNIFGHYSDKNKSIRDGKWISVHTNGGLEGEIIYKNGKIDGQIIAFNSEGIKTLVSNKSEGIFNGSYSTYYDNGLLEFEAIMKDNEYDGLFKKYYSSGQIREEGIAKKSQMMGVVNGYYVNGNLHYKIPYNNGETDGLLTYYYPDGVVKEKYFNIKGKSSGDYYLYYPDSTIQKVGKYNKDKMVGNWKEYYPNGVLQSEYTYNEKSELIGTQKDYYADGKLSRDVIYDGSKSNSTWYGRDGKVYCKMNGDSKKINSFEYYDKRGKVIDKEEISSKTLNFRLRDEFGNILREGKIVNGKYEGVMIYYNHNGKIIETRIYKNDENNGNDSVFAENGSLKFVLPYKNGVLNGYAEQYHLNGNISREGWYVDGNQQGMWKDYYADGTIKATNYYSNGEYQGWQEFYNPNGKIDEQNYYDYNHFEAKMMYDSTGKVTNKSSLTNGNGLYELKSQNGTVIVRGELKGGANNGKFENFHANGQKKSISNYLNNYKYGKHESFTEDGLISYTVSYINGNRYGTYESFDKGKKDYSCKYYNDDIYGITRWIYPNGKSEIEYNYLANSLDGLSSFYAPDGQLMYAVNFIDNNPYSYTYKDKNGNLVPPISIGKDTVHIVAYYQNGKKSADFFYYSGTKSGPYETFYPNGQTYLKYNRIGSEYNGTYYEYYQNGKLNKLKNYYYGELNGESKTYYDNGIIQDEEYFVFDMKHGTAKYYDNTGKLTLSRNYYYGVILSEIKY